MSSRSDGRGRLPTWVVRIRFVLRFMVCSLTRSRRERLAGARRDGAPVDQLRERDVLERDPQRLEQGDVGRRAAAAHSAGDEIAELVDVVPGKPSRAREIAELGRLDLRL